MLLDCFSCLSVLLGCVDWFCWLVWFCGCALWWFGLVGLVFGVCCALVDAALLLLGLRGCVICVYVFWWLVWLMDYVTGVVGLLLYVSSAFGSYGSDGSCLLRVGVLLCGLDVACLVVFRLVGGLWFAACAFVLCGEWRVIGCCGCRFVYYCFVVVFGITYLSVVDSVVLTCY